MSGVRAVGLCGAMLMLGLSLQGCGLEHEDFIRAGGFCALVDNSTNNTRRLASRRLVANNLPNIPLPNGTLPNVSSLAKVLLQTALHELINNGTFLSGISSATQHIPDKMEFDVGGSTRDELDAFGVCKINYAVGASVQECSGMQNIVMEIASNETFFRESDGELTTTIPLTISAGPITCTAYACATGSGCGLEISPSVVVKPSLSVNGVGIKAVMRVADGDGDDVGKMCLKVSKVVVDGGEFDWGNLEVNLSGYMFSIPANVLQRAWENVPLDEITSTLTDQLSSTLEGALGAMSTCIDVPQLPAIPQS